MLLWLEGFVQAVCLSVLQAAVFLEIEIAGKKDPAHPVVGFMDQARMCS